MKKLTKKIITLILSMAVLLTAIPIGVVLAAEENVPTITVTNTTVSAGNYAYFYVDASNFADLVGVEYSLHYDADVMSVNWCYTGTMVSGSTVDINKDTAGEIRCSVMNIDGLNGNGRLLRIGFKTNASAEAGSYPITLTIGDAYDSSFSSISITKVSGTLTLQEGEATATSISFTTSCDKAVVNKGDTFTYTLKGAHYSGPACGNFEFQYDRDLLELTNVTLGSKLLTDTALYSINSETAGYVKISYADVQSLSSVYGKEYFVLEFAVKENVDATTAIEFSANSLVTADFENMKTDNLTQAVTIAYVEEEVTYPAVKLVSGDVGRDGTFAVDVVLEAGSDIAAGDFTVTYDQSQIKCNAVKVNSAVTSNGGYLIAKEEITEGTVAFSYVNMNPFVEEQVIATLSFESAEDFDGETALQISGKDVVNAAYSDVILEYENTISDIPVRIVSASCSGVKTDYYVGEALDTTGLVLTLNYSDGTSQTVTEGYAVSEFDSSTIGVKLIAVSYEYFQTSYEVSVREKIVGDANRDGVIDVRDCVRIIKILCGAEAETVEADIDNNGTVTEQDKKYLCMHLVYMDPDNLEDGQAVVNRAEDYLGVPYQWGGTSTNGIDTAGLVFKAYEAIGVTVPRYAGAITAGGTEISPLDARPGDVVCYAGSVGIYIGNGNMILAQRTGTVVKVMKVYGSPWFRRYW